MSLYAHWMNSWERRLTLKDPNRKIYPFDWGVEWVGADPRQVPRPLEYFERFAEEALLNSEEFFAPPGLPEMTDEGDNLSFISPSVTPHPENNRVVCRVFPGGSKERAVIVVPQWNADAESHVGLCKILSRLGVTACRITLPYHELRTPVGMARADFMVSPNIGRTLHAAQQAVKEVRQLALWLKKEGFRHIGIMGTSLGSCVSYLAFVHDPTIEAGVFNHVSSYFADVVWSGLSTRYVLWGLEGNIRLPELRKCWAPLSPAAFTHKLKNQYRPHLMITAKYDMTFPPELAEKIFDKYQEHSLQLDRVTLPCGHYTLAHFPYNYWVAWHICRFVIRKLPKG